MTRTQIQLPEPLFGNLRRIAGVRDISVAELIRRGMELYLKTCPEVAEVGEGWTMPILRGSGGHLQDIGAIRAEAEAIEARNAPAAP